MTVLRADAERNRSAVLCAAASVFAETGLNAPLEDIAHAAGVGIATLYRRFPTREALVEAVFEAKIARYADRAVAAAERARNEPWDAFRDHVLALVELQVDDPAFGSALLRPLQGSCMFARDHDRAVRATRLLISRVRRAGVVKTDLHHSDLYLLLASTAAIVAQPGPLDERLAARRLAAIFLTALHTDHHGAPT